MKMSVGVFVLGEIVVVVVVVVVVVGLRINATKQKND